MKSFHFHRNNVVSSSVGTHWYTYIPRWSLTKSTFRQIVHTHCLRQLSVWRTLITKPLRHYSRPDTDAMFSIDVHKNIIDYKLNLCLCILVMCNFFWETLLINSNNIFFKSSLYQNSYTVTCNTFYGGDKNGIHFPIVVHPLGGIPIFSSQWTPKSGT